MKRIVVCADDYGMNEGTSRGILELAQGGRISATSCMTNAAHWPAAAPALREVEDRIAIGLHVTLSWGRALGAMPGLASDGRLPPLGSVLRRSMAGRIDRGEVAAEVGRQLSAFREALGRDPDFVDGHQHAHVLTGIRAPLLGVLEAEGLADRLWLRDPSDHPAAILGRRRGAGKALLVAALARGFRRDAERAGFRTNHGFSGFSAFDPARDPSDDLAPALRALGECPLLMCHPGLADAGPERDGEADEIAASRPNEQAFLASSRWSELLARNGLTLSRQPAPHGSRPSP